MLIISTNYQVFQHSQILTKPNNHTIISALFFHSLEIIMLSKAKLMSLSLAQLVVVLSLPFVTGALKAKIFQQILFFIIALGLSYLITHFWDKKLHYSYPALEFSEIKTITIPCLALASLSYLILQFCPFQFTDWLILTISLSSSVTIFLSLISLKA